MKRRLLVLALLAAFGCDDDDPSGVSGSSGDAGSDGAASNASADESAGATGSGMSGCDGGPLAQPIAGCTPTPLAKTGDFGQDCVDRINQFRWECQCLPPLARWTEAEMCTDEQSGTDQQGGTAHANFGMCSEFAQNTCPDWPNENEVLDGCLQLMWDEGPGEPFEAHGHYINMSSTEYSKVACGRTTTKNAPVWSNQNFSP